MWAQEIIIRVSSKLSNVAVGGIVKRKNDLSVKAKTSMKMMMSAKTAALKAHTLFGPSGVKQNCLIS